jgi:NAD(P)-dependent dehydrogenase (short-subunit alcohol dehydrogenase family)
VSKIHESIDELQLKFPSVDYRSLEIDLSSQQSVRTAAAELLSWSDIPTLDIIVNSAGIMLLPERTINEDGIEMHFATNHVGHFLLTCLVMPKLIKAAERNPKGTTRIINVSSASPSFASMRWSDMNFEKKSKDLPEAERPNYDAHRRWGASDPENTAYLPLEGYNVSKVANVLFGIAANARLYKKYGILSLALHPGVMQTQLGRYASDDVLAALENIIKSNIYTYRTLGAGASTSLVAALDPKLGVGETRDGKENYGTYLADCQISDSALPLAVSSSEAEKLWNLSENVVKEKFAW